MRTKLSVFCDRLLEAGWLLALVVAPLFFNVYSSRVFEPDKLAWVLLLGLLAAWAFAVRAVEGWPSRRPPTIRASLSLGW